MEQSEEKNNEIKYYQCVICEKAFKHDFQLQNHIKIGHGLKPSQFNNKDKKPKTYKCNSCDEIFKTDHYLKKHKKSRNCTPIDKTKALENDFPKEGSLEQNDTTITDDSNEISDIKSNSEADSGTFDHDDFDFEKNSSDDQPVKDQDVKSVQDSLKNIKCDFCDEIFEDDLSLIEHVSETHITFSDILNTESEIETSAPDIKVERDREILEVKCNSCEMTFENEWNLKFHVQSLHRHKIKCDKCEKYFYNQNELQNHSKTHNENSCRFCQQIFENVWILKFHEQAIHQSNSSKTTIQNKTITVTTEEIVDQSIENQLDEDQSNEDDEQVNEDEDQSNEDEDRSNEDEDRSNEDEYQSNEDEDQSIEDQSIKKQSVGDQSIEDQSLEGQSIIDHSIDDQSNEDKEQPIEDQVIDDEIQDFEEVEQPESEAEDDIEPIEIVKLKCQYCDIEFSYHQELQNHISLKHENQSESKANYVECQICVQVFDTVQEIVSHFAFEHSESIKKEPEINTCKFCNEVFNSEQEYQEHSKSHKLQEAKFECKKCNKTFETQIHMKKHLDLHFKHQCPRCNRWFTNREKLSDHMRQFHKIPKSHVSYFLDKVQIGSTFEEMELILKDVKDKSKSIFGKTKIHQTQKLDKKVLAKVDTEPKNNDTKETEKKNFKCHICQKSSRDKSALKDHMKYFHEAENNFPCQFCDFSYNKKESLFQHIKHKHADKVEHLKCKTCGSIWSSEKKLQKHILTHEKTKDFTCPACNHATLSKNSIIAHMRKKHNFTKTKARQMVGDLP